MKTFSPPSKLDNWAKRQYRSWSSTDLHSLSDRVAELPFDNHDLLYRLSAPLPISLVVYRADNPDQLKLRHQQYLSLDDQDFWSTSLNKEIPVERDLGERLLEMHLPAGWGAIPVWPCGFDNADEMELIISPGKWRVSKMETRYYKLTAW